MSPKDQQIDYIFGCHCMGAVVSRQETLSFFEGPQSPDHRALYIDLHLDHQIGAESNEYPLAPAQRRWLQSGNPKAAEIYLAKIQQYYTAHRMKERMDKMFSGHNELPQSEVRRLLTQWDTDQGRAMRSAESALITQPKLYQWFPKLRNTGVVLRFWKLRLRELKYSKDYSTTFESWEQYIQVYDCFFVLPEPHRWLDMQDVRSHWNRTHEYLRKHRETRQQIASVVKRIHLNAILRIQSHNSKRVTTLSQNSQANTSNRSDQTITWKTPDDHEPIRIFGLACRKSRLLQTAMEPDK